MSPKKPQVALIYDFDGTLSPGNMQEFGFIKALGMNEKDFWTKSAALSKDNDASSILCYMKLMLSEAQYKKVSITKKSFRDFGKEIELYSGVEKWFSLVNKYGQKLGVDIKHYINSSGLKEMIEGSPIAKEFEHIYACSFLYDASEVAEWPGVAVDFTTKTQFIFKINKGIKEVYDSKEVNKYVAEEDRPIPFKRMIYFGDGETDIPCMKMVKQNGGYSIAVYNPSKKGKKDIAKKLISEDRVNFVCSADYKKSSDIYEVVTTILQKIKRDYDFDTLLQKHKKLAK